MSGLCPAIAGDAGVVERLAAYVECQSRQIELAGFQGGVWHGLPTALVAVLLALYVAGIGYRLILYHQLDTASLIHAVLRLGFVIAAATTFTTYSALVYTVSTQGPQELAAMALAPTGLRTPSLTEASHSAAGYLDALAGPSQAVPVPAPPSAGGDPSVPPPAPGPSPATSGHDLGNAVLMLSCVGFSLAARLVQAIVLAVGPLFIAAALFDMSIGLFAGWLRAMIALFIAQTGYAVSSAVELSFLARDLSHLSQAPDASAPLLIGLFFLAGGAAITVVAVLAASGFLPIDLIRRAGTFVTARMGTEAPSTPRSPWPVAEIRTEPPVSRAQRVTDAVGALAVADEQRQNNNRGGGGGAASAWAGSADSSAGAGPGLRRPTHMRASTGAAKRDLIS
ncbi:MULTISPECIES: type IV secretion system protein [Asticcacaulis]|uniref:type IV secretion system protein n=1 Tax=Asticcacaulis TaxID=76890 RepID=UPI001AE2C529|nr:MULTISPECIES: type IV secretion system protein [Asticcacaulis]MBP2161213.1 type IV secretion system protein VirB6 [Asticcacaulis solisilvae]MDR6802258.1 type IV secretion system protein VirB6 [Asticcacaulis sp. BE141]